MKVASPNYLPWTILNREESNLLEFFKDSRSLLLGPTDEEQVAQFILQVALSASADANNSVLQSILAISSLHLQGDSQSFCYKRLAVSAVAQEPSDWLDEKILLQNLMTAMLLYHYELSHVSTSKEGWLVFFCAVKRIINTAPAFHKLIRQEYSVFLDWIFYHEALSEFTVRHWKVPYDGCGFIPVSRSPKAMDRVDSKVGDIVGCPTDVLQLIVHTCRKALVSQPSDSISGNDNMQLMNVLEQNVSRSAEDHDHVLIQSTTPTSRQAMVSNIHRLASLIYVNRVVHRIPETDIRHRRLVQAAMSLLINMKTCQNAWPLFIITLEAIDDDQRLAVLDVFEQSQQDPRRRSSHIYLIQSMVEAVWKQYDLDTENRIDYVTILNAVIQAVPFMPPFA